MSSANLEAMRQAITTSFQNGFKVAGNLPFPVAYENQKFQQPAAATWGR